MAGGQIAYVVRKTDKVSNMFEMRICDGQGKLVQTLLISGSSFYLSADGRVGYVSGPQRETVSFETMQIIEQNAPLAVPADEELLTALRGAVTIYAEMRLGQQASAADIEQYFSDNDKLGGMAQSEIWTRQPETSQDKTVCYRAVLDREHSLISTEGDMATCHLVLSGMDHNGVAFSEQLAWDVVKRSGRWQVAGLSTFTQEQERTAVLSAASQFLQSGVVRLPVATEQIHWRQIQYWLKDKSGLAGWMDEAEWAKVDGDPGGLIIWLRREDTHWLVEQIWYGEGWIYPDTQE